MSIECLQQGELPILSPVATSLPDRPYITLTELVAFLAWGAPLTPHPRGTLRQCTHDEELAHRRSARKDYDTSEINRATTRIYSILGHAVARSQVTLWGRPRIGEQRAAYELERIPPTYLLIARHHDLYENELHERISIGDELHVFDREERERHSQHIRYLDIELSIGDAEVLTRQFRTQQTSSTVSLPPQPNARRWRPLHVGIAWALTKDEQFCADIAHNVSAAERLFCASAQLESEMITAGCFRVVNEMLQLDPPSRVIEIKTHRLVRGYSGRFRELAEDYELRGRREFTLEIEQRPHDILSAANRVSLGDFLLGRWIEAFNAIMARVSDDEVSARGVPVDDGVRGAAGELPSSSVTRSMWLDLNGIIWEGPQGTTTYDRPPRQWIDVSLNWEQLQRSFSNDPVAGHALPPTSPGPAKTIEGILAVDSAVFPSGPPKGMRADDRRRKLREYYRSCGMTPPSDRSFQRAKIGKT